ncbi:MAG: pterin-4-alpha-carbinolamine dehydratase [Flavobacteriaceae bacterium]|nr:pterin-4-alpha-carbinolamine dehydratase [Flavobacteriaceae bacterium]|tara:strand:+ start:613 stop:849 length:237 start_codon:yes stop_codon:yes gene_type:complete
MEPLKRKYSFSSFEEAIVFIDQVAPIFSRENHHPQITNFYNTVEFVYFTTSANNTVTELDHKIANEVESSYKTLIRQS